MFLGFHTLDLIPRATLCWFDFYCSLINKSMNVNLSLHLALQCLHRELFLADYLNSLSFTVEMAQRVFKLCSN